MLFISTARAAAAVIAADPNIKPNGTGLPGLPQVRQIVGALLTWGR